MRIFSGLLIITPVVYVNLAFLIEELPSTPGLLVFEKVVILNFLILPLMLSHKFDQILDRLQNKSGE